MTFQKARRKQKVSLETPAVIQARAVGACASGRAHSEKWSDSGYILKVELTVYQ